MSTPPNLTPLPLRPSSGELPPATATQLAQILGAIENRDFHCLQAVSVNMDWQALLEHNRAVVRSRSAPPSIEPLDNILASLAICVASRVPTRGSGQAREEAFALKALNHLVAAGYRALDAHDLEAVMMGQGGEARFTRALARVGYRHGLRDAQGAAVLHHALVLAGTRIKHLETAARFAALAGQINAQDNAGNTVWHRWCTAPFLPLVVALLVPACAQGLALLLKQGLDPTRKNHQGQTGEECLAAGSSKGIDPALIQAWRAELVAHRQRELDRVLPTSAVGARSATPRF